MVALARVGRSVESLAREYEPCAATIHDWVKQASADDGERDDREPSRVFCPIGVAYLGRVPQRFLCLSQPPGILPMMRLTGWMIAAIHEASKETYGAPRIHAELADEGVHVGRKRIERLMKAKGLRDVSRRKFVVTTERDPRALPASDLVDRNFYAGAPNVLLVVDITYVPTRAGFLYLAVVLDAFNRRIIGWAMGND